MLELLIAVVVAALLAAIDLAGVRYRFFSAWAGRRRTRISVTACLVLNGAAGATVWWLAQQTASTNRADPWWVIRGVAFGTAGYAIMNAPIPNPDRSSVAVSLLSKLNTVTMNLLVADSNAAVYGKVRKYGTLKLARESLELLHRYVNLDEKLGKETQMEIGAKMRARIRELDSKEEVVRLEAQVALRTSCANLILQYQHLPSRKKRAVNDRPIAST
jgi:hypothetical protein